MQNQPTRNRGSGMYRFAANSSVLAQNKKAGGKYRRLRE
jgi:hypothetical protein